MIDKELKIPPQLYRQLSDLLESGKVVDDFFELDLSHVQTITVKGGKLIFSPPVAVKIKYMGISLNTTISEITNKRKGIEVNIDNSPIDLKVVPDA